MKRIVRLACVGRLRGQKRRRTRSVKSVISHSAMIKLRFRRRYRVYQTATPKVFDVKPPRGKTDWVVRTMDDESVFGVELYRKSYPEAVK